MDLSCCLDRPLLVSVDAKCNALAKVAAGNMLKKLIFYSHFTTKVTYVDEIKIFIFCENKFREIKL